MDSPARLRMNRTALIPVGLLALCAVPLAFAAPWTPVLLLVPLAVAVWVLRAGVDIADDGLTVRSLAGQRLVPWERARRHPGGPPRRPVAGHHPRHRGARAGDAGPRPAPPRGELSGGRIDVPAPPQDQ